MPDDLQADVAAIGDIAAVPTILDVVCRTTGMGFAAIARVTEDRWIACGVKDDIGFGLKPGGELKVETTICHEIRGHREAVVINNVSEDPVWAAHHTPAMYGLQSYISMPIMLADGRFFGTLCAIDPRPMRLNTPEVIGMFKLFAELIAFHLDAGQKLELSEAQLKTELAQSELRDQFIAVLGHDLRNPLASIDAGARILTRGQPDTKTANILDLMRGSVQRMAGLIDNLMDFARGRLGGGLPLTRAPVALEPVLEQVAAELAAGTPGRAVETQLALGEPVLCDAPRIGQLFSNLLANALTHGAKDQPVRVSAETVDGQFHLTVANGGEPIPAAAMARLFQPFFRGEGRSSAQGLGLGLYIASEIARAHGGTLAVSSTEAETRLTFRMPVG